MKKDVLTTIYEMYEQWAGRIDFCCEPGCSVCCTQDVTITALEGEIIYDFISANQRQTWLAEILTTTEINRDKAGPTTNEFALACLNGDLPSEKPSSKKICPCPFLLDNHCAIYQVRPFSCRCFASTKKCQPGGTGIMPSAIISGATAGQQIIEHLGQGELWGNMLDVLLALADLPQHKKVATAITDGQMMAYAQARLISARPLPGFLIPPEDNNEVQVLLQEIFNRKVEGKKIEDFLNGH